MEKNKTTVLKVFLQLNNNNDVVPTLKTMQNKIQFHHNKEIDMIKNGGKIPNPLCVCDKKLPEEMIGAPTIVAYN